MKRIISIFCFSLIIGLSISSHLWASTVNVEVLHSQEKYQAGGSYPVLFRMNISKSWYIHGTKEEDDGLIPTVLSFKSDIKTLQIEEVRFPAPEEKKFDYTSDRAEVYSGEILVQATLKVDADTVPGEYDLKGVLSYQACSQKACLPPEDVLFAINVSVVPAGTPVKALNQDLFDSLSPQKAPGTDFLGSRVNKGFLLTLSLIFVGGLALNLTPCIYPLIPITVSYFGGMGERRFRHTILHGILYLTGLAVTNSALGVSSALSGGMLGSALQNPVVLLFIAAVMTALGLSFFGLWELRVPSKLTRIASMSYKGYFGTFFMGLTLGIVAAPCVGPFIIGLFTYVGHKGDPFLGFLYFFILSIGMGLPLCVLAVFSGAIDRLPMSGDWMVWIRKFMGWVLIGMAAYFICPLLPDPHTGSLLYAAIIIAAGIHLGLLDRTGRGVKRFNLIKRIAGTVIILLGIIYLLSVVEKKEGGINWIEYPRVIHYAAPDPRPIILDVYGDWCVPCKELDEKVFNDPEVVRLSKEFQTLRLDMTKKRPFQKAFKARYDFVGVPLVLFMNSKGVEERDLRVESFVDKTVFLDRMKKLLDRSS